MDRSDRITLKFWHGIPLSSDKIQTQKAWRQSLDIRLQPLFWPGRDGRQVCTWVTRIKISPFISDYTYCFLNLSFFPGCKFGIYMMNLHPHKNLLLIYSARLISIYLWLHGVYVCTSPSTPQPLVGSWSKSPFTESEITELDESYASHDLPQPNASSAHSLCHWLAGIFNFFLRNSYFLSMLLSQAHQTHSLTLDLLSVVFFLILQALCMTHTYSTSIHHTWSMYHRC